jgi:hypothetical protein
VVNIPPEICNGVFDNEFEQGSVIKTKIRFPSGLERNKYLVILNKNPKNDSILYFLTTSQLDFYDKHPGYNKDIVRLPPGKVSYWQKETVIDCMKLHRGTRSTFEANFQTGTLSFAGLLSSDVLDDIKRIVEQSFFISKNEKEAILEDSFSPPTPT